MGEEVVDVPGLIIAEPEPHGFVTPGGGWSLYGPEGYVRSWRVRFRHDRKRRDVYLRLDDWCP
jgi:hypothetical protein